MGMALQAISITQVYGCGIWNCWDPSTCLGIIFMLRPRISTFAVEFACMVNFRPGVIPLGPKYRSRHKLSSYQSLNSIGAFMKFIYLLDNVTCNASRTADLKAPFNHLPAGDYK